MRGVPRKQLKKYIFTLDIEDMFNIKRFKYYLLQVYTVVLVKYIWIKRSTF